MTITTLAQANDGRTNDLTMTKTIGFGNIAGLGTSWSSAGFPVAGTYDTTLNGVALSSPVTGQIPFENGTGGLEAYIYSLTANARNPMIVYVCDRLWHNGGINITSTSLQSITSPAFPARDRNALTNGEDVFLDLEVSAATGAGVPTITVDYTNSDGTASRVGTNIIATIASSFLRTAYPIGVQSGDKGVRSVQGITLSASWTSGTINLVARRQLAAVLIKRDGERGAIDAITGCLSKIHPNSVPYLMSRTFSARTVAEVAATLRYTYG